MSELEKALTEAIRALIAARHALNQAAWAYDDVAGKALDDGDTLQAILQGIHEGEMRAYAESLDAKLTNLRRLRKEARQ